jgi:hypothetical protein
MPEILPDLGRRPCVSADSWVIGEAARYADFFSGTRNSIIFALFARPLALAAGRNEYGT